MAVEPFAPAAASSGRPPRRPASVHASFLHLVERFRPEEADGLVGTWQIELAGHPDTTVVVRDHGCRVVRAPSDTAPDAVLRTDADTWLDLVTGRRDGLAAYREGRLRVEGDLHLALRLETLFGPGPQATRPLRSLRTGVRGVTVDALVAGYGTPVVLLHGLGANKLSFVPTIDGLGHTHEVHALDLPGFGRSDKPLPSGRRYSPGWFADVVAGYVAVNRLGPVFVVGNSLGGRVAAEVALRHPRTVRGIVTLGSAVAFDEWQAWAALLRATRGQWLGITPLPLRHAWVRSAMADLLFHDPTRIADADVDAGAADVLRSTRDPGYRLAVVACARHLAIERARGRRGFWRRLASLGPPSYWIWGAGDRLVSSHYADRVRHRLPAARVEVWPDVGHVPQFEAPDRTVAAIRGFVDDATAY